MQPQSGGFFVSREEYDERMTQINMARHERATRYYRFMTEMKPEDLSTFMDIMSEAADENSGQAFCYTMIGQVIAIQKIKNNRCVCGVDHDGEALEAAKNALEIERLSNEAEPNPAMVAYNMTIKDGALACAGCGQVYPSLEDRMLRNPDDCSGCKQKSAWG